MLQVVSPQLYLATLTGADCCSVSDMFMIAYDPQDRFHHPALAEPESGQRLRLGEVVGGDYIFATEGLENLKVYGYLVTLKANLEPTGTGLDQSLFMTFDTARDIASKSVTQAEQPAGNPARQHLGRAGQSAAGQRPAPGISQDLAAGARRHAYRKRQYVPVLPHSK